MEREIKVKMIEVFNNNFIEDIIISNNFFLNVWNCMFMMVNEFYCLSCFKFLKIFYLIKYKMIFFN